MAKFDGGMWIVGLGPGPLSLCTGRGLELIGQADLVVGGKRNLESLGVLIEGKATLEVGADIPGLIRHLCGNDGKERVVVVVSGDPGLFSLMDALTSAAQDLPVPWRDFEVVPGISALQYLCARLRRGWHDLAIVSAHGRPALDLIGKARTSARLAVYTGGSDGPAAVCRTLAGAGLGKWRVAVGERLAYPEERIIHAQVDELLEAKFDSLSLLIVEAPALPTAKMATALPLPAIEPTFLSDAAFRRGNIPMTKQDIRVLVVAQLDLRADSVVWDIGAGTGSVAVECARQCPAGQVWAIERDPEGLELIAANARSLGVANLKIVSGEAPAALSGLPRPDRVFIGGSGGAMAAILGLVADLRPRPLIAITAVTIESAAEALAGLKESGFGGIDIRQVAVSVGEAVGGKHLLRAQNPICIISAKGEDA